MMQSIARTLPPPWDSLQEMVNTAAQLVESSIEASNSANYYINIRRFYPHAIQCVQNINLLKKAPEDETNGHSRQFPGLDPSTMPELRNIALLLLDSGSTKTAKTLYDLALGEFPIGVSVPGYQKEAYYIMLFNRARVYKPEGHFKQAQNYYERSLKYVEGRYGGNTDSIKQAILFNMD